jgi:molybdate transport system substrate-binding protein
MRPPASHSSRPGLIRCEALRGRVLAAFIVCIGLTLCNGDAVAAEIKVMASTGVTAILRDLGPAFERTSHQKLNVEYEVTAVLKRRIEDGAAFDVAILTAAATDDLINEDRIVAGTRANIARSGMGLAIRAGAIKPDISTVETFKQALLSAQSVAYNSQGAAGQYFAALLVRLGIADQVGGKAKLQASSTELVAKGEAELSVQQISEILAVRGAELVGPFPPELQSYTVFTAGVSANAAQAEVGQALIDFLRSPEALSVMTARGMEPPG